MNAFRLLAGFLSFGGCFWGLFCLMFMLPPTPSGLLYFGPGYLITAGYLTRLFWTPPVAARRFIWASSGMVQGWWLAWAMFFVVQGGWFQGATGFAAVTLGWWWASFLGSLLGLAFDGEPGIVLE